MARPRSAPLPRVEGLEGSLEAQLASLYADKQTLQDALGISAADEIIAMVRSLEEQLVDLYAGRDAAVR